MTPLETRLRALRNPPAAGPPPGDLRDRAAGRRARRRRRLVLSVVPVVAVVAGVLAVAVPEESEERLVSGPGPVSVPVDEAELNRVLGGVTGVSVVVSPHADLLDGDLVEVSIEGLEALPEAKILQCAGDVTGDDAAVSCSTNAVQRPGEPGGFVDATAHQVVSIARTIDVGRGSADPNQSRPYDCAVEDAGCVLAVAPYELPARAVLVPLTFRDVPATVPTAAATPSSELVDGQEVTVAAHGLRPNATFGVALCGTAPDTTCHELEHVSATSDDDGTIETRITMRSAIYGWRGRVDCVADPCSVVITGPTGRLTETPFTFASGTQAPRPELHLDPPGPYTDGQTVTVHGAGFPPGFDIGRWLGQCPADKDTAQEERCGYPLAFSTVIVDAAGSFTADLQVRDSLLYTGTCVTGPGCLLAWVLNHGPIAASVPLEFVP